MVPADPTPAHDALTSLVVAVVPALNEAYSIASVVKGTSEYVDHVIVIDDGSSDDTRELAEGAGAVVLHHPKRVRVGAAVARARPRQGARRHGRALVMPSG